MTASDDHEHPDSDESTAAEQSAGLESRRAAAAHERGESAQRTLALAGGLVALLLLGGLAVLLLGNSRGHGQRHKNAKSGEVKQHLHEIQLAVERYGVDHGGKFPAYLIGGSLSYRAYWLADGSNAGVPPSGQAQAADASDPLLAEGYMSEYPRNPFVHDGSAIHHLQEHLPSSMLGEDPLRNGCDVAYRCGTRFGPDCDRMGCVLADPRYGRPGAAIRGPGGGGYDDMPGGGRGGYGGLSYADVEYPFWDVWQAERPLPFLPGEFFYKSAGEISLPGGDRVDTMASSIPAHEEPRSYILGAYGAATERGLDVLGPEPKLQLPDGRKLFTHTASSYTSRDGSPFGPADAATHKRRIEGGTALSFGNPNGIDDAIILLLCSKDGKPQP